MTDYTAVNAAGMADGIAALDKAHKDLQSHLDHLESSLSSSLAKWDGAAQETYKQAQAKWDAAAAHMHQVVVKMSSVLGQITENYSSTEKRIGASWA